MNLKKELKVAIAAAKEASEVLNQGFTQTIRITKNKSGVIANLVTQYDYKAQEVILKHITNNFPEHAILSEEGVDKRSHSPFQWIIDPLDGTTNFSRKIPNFGVSIALQHNSELVLGVIAIPSQNEIYYATKGNGAFLNGKKISVSESKKLPSAMISVSMDRSKEALKLGTKTFNKLTLAPTKPRVTGSLVTDLARVAAGNLDGTIFNNLYPWDFAAGVVLIREAGGSVTKVDGSRFDLYGKQYIASNKNLHKQLQKLLR